MLSWNLIVFFDWKRIVCVFFDEEDVELRSDIYGISYAPMDEHGAWKMKLAQEIASVGITVDMNKLLRIG